MFVTVRGIMTISVEVNNNAVHGNSKYIRGERQPYSHLSSQLYYTLDFFYIQGHSICKMSGVV